MTTSMRLRNSGENRFRTAASPMLSSLFAISALVRDSMAWKPMFGRTSRSISRAPRLLVRKNKRLLELHDRIVAHTQAPLVENAQQQRIQRRRGLFDLIEQDDRDIALLTDNAQQPFLCQQRLCLTVADISRRRADQLSDFMVRLVLGAVDPEKLLL